MSYGTRILSKLGYKLFLNIYEESVEFPNQSYNQERVSGIHGEYEAFSSLRVLSICIISRLVETHFFPLILLSSKNLSFETQH